MRAPSPTILHLTDCTVDLARHQIDRDGSITNLTTREAELLHYLSNHHGEDVDRAALLEDVWGYRSTNPTRAVDFTIRRLRSKIEPVPAKPIHIISVRGIGYRFVAASTPNTSRSPPRAPAPIQAHSLPAPRTRFIARDSLFNTLTEQAQSHRLVTLLGIGGAGKTALALHWARHHLADYPGGVWFCDLSPARSTTEVIGAIARGLGADLDPHATEPQAIEHLAGTLEALSKTLLVLDNAEHINLTPLVESWLDRAFEARFLITSRERLQLRGEHLVHINPMSVEEGLQLFLERASAVRDAAVSAEERSTARAIVIALDGLPLAIEIAASRVATMSVHQLSERIGSRFQLLTAPGSGRPERHSSLRATLDWSWELLDRWEQRALASASVFRGGFSLEAAEEILQDDSPEAPWTLDVLQSLRDKSLIQLDSPESSREMRFRLLESVRAYATERLQEHGNEADVRRKHATYFIREGDNLSESVIGPRGGQILSRLAQDRGNYMTAWQNAPDPIQRVRAGLILRVILLSQGPLDQYKQLLDSMVQLAATGPKALQARTLIARARFYAHHQDNLAVEDIESAIELSHAADRTDLQAMALSTRAGLYTSAGRLAEAEASYRLAHTLNTERNDPSSAGRDAIGLAFVLSRRGEVAEAERTYQRALTTFRRSGDRWGTGLALANLFGVVDGRGRFEAADTYAAEAVELLTEVGDQQNCARVLAQHGMRLHWRGRSEDAEANLRRALSLQQALGDRRWEGTLLTDLAIVLLANDRLAEAEGILLDATRIAQDAEDSLQQARILCQRGLLRLLEDADWDAETHLNESLSLLREHKLHTFLPPTLLYLALVYLRQSRLDQVPDLLDEANAHAARLGHFRLQSLVAATYAIHHCLTGNLQEAATGLDRTTERMGPYAISLSALPAIVEAWIEWARAVQDHELPDTAETMASRVCSTNPTVTILRRELLNKIRPEPTLELFG